MMRRTTAPGSTTELNLAAGAACANIGRFVTRPPGGQTAEILSLEGLFALANIKSQKKRILTNAKAQARNKAVRSSLKTLIKQVNEAVASGDEASAAEKLAVANRALDKAASKGIVHKNQAANRKSGIAAAVAKMGS